MMREPEPATTTGDVRSAPVPDGRADLRADCSNCAGLCCVALAFVKSGGFAFDKGAGEPCTHLQDDFRCGIHPVLRERGFPGCTTFDCQGAGQKVTQVTFGGRTWRQHDPESRDLVFATFQVVRALHELLWYLTDAMSRPAARPVHPDLSRAHAEIDALTRQAADDVMAVDLTAQRERVGAVLARASALVRADAQRAGPSTAARAARPGADLAGSDLRGAELRGAHLIAADLRRCDLTGADVIGADLREADVRGADLSQTLFLTQFQVNSAKGDAGTQLPSWLTRPAHWG